VRLIKLVHLINRFLLLGLSLIFFSMAILIFTYVYFRWNLLLNSENILALFSNDIDKLLNRAFEVLTPSRMEKILDIVKAIYKFVLPLILILTLMLIYQSFNKYLNSCIDLSLRQMDRVVRVIYRDTSLLTFIVMILCLYQLSHLILSYSKSPPVIIPYSGILKSELLHYKRFESNVYDGIIWYFTKAPASMASSHPIIDYGDSAKNFSQANLMPEYYLCDNSSIAFINAGGFRNKEPYVGFASEFDGKNCAYVANFLEKHGYKIIIKTPRYSINQFPRE
jgi:hypothetical protein